MLPVDFNIGWGVGGGGGLSVKSSSECLITLFECAVSQDIFAMIEGGYNHLKQAQVQVK